MGKWIDSTSWNGTSTDKVITTISLLKLLRKWYNEFEWIENKSSNNLI